MNRLLVIGHKGTLGRYLFKQAHDKFDHVLGLSRQETMNYQNGKMTSQPLDKQLAVNEVVDLAASFTHIINAAWTSNSRSERDLNHHTLQAEWETNLISQVLKLSIRYVSLGSIAEVHRFESTTQYAKEKQKLRQFLEGNSLNFLWLRIASAYGLGDRRMWFIPQLIHALSLGKELKLQKRGVRLNFCHFDALAHHIIDLTMTKDIGTKNIYTTQWYKLDDVVAGMSSGIEPKQRHSPIFGAFDHTDPSGSEVKSPPLIAKLRDLVREERAHFW